MADQEKITLVAVGDLTFSKDHETRLALAAPVLREADIAFGQLETAILSERVNPAWNWIVTENPASVGTALVNAGFDVVSVAGNFHMLGGPEALADTINILRDHNILPIGVGMNIAEARTPAILERKGTKVAFLGYDSIIPRCELPWEARLNKPGCAPMFINTFYDQIDFQPGTPPRIITFAEKQNLADMEDDMRRAKAQADVVVMSIHWGIHHVPAVIAMYEYEVGHAAIDAGADLVLGHHAHLLKGIEVYKGKVIFHCLGNFVHHLGPHKPGIRGYWEELRPPHVPLRQLGWSQFPGTPLSIFTSSKQYPPPEERLSMIAKCIVSGKKIERVSFRPCMLNDADQPEPLSGKDKRSDEVYQYVEWACKEQGLDTRFSRDGDDVVVLT